MKIAGICLAAALLASGLDRREHALAAAMGVLVCACALIACLRALRPATRFFLKLRALTALDEQYFLPLVKCVGIGVVTQISGAVCDDCGQRAMARTAEVCGTCACAVLSLPLMEAALDLLRQMIERG